MPTQRTGIAVGSDHEKPEPHVAAALDGSFVLCSGDCCCRRSKLTLRDTECCRQCNLFTRQEVAGDKNAPGLVSETLVSKQRRNGIGESSEAGQFAVGGRLKLGIEGLPEPVPGQMMEGHPNIGCSLATMSDDPPVRQELVGQFR